MEKKRRIYIERGGDHDEPNLLVSINGKNWVLPRGKESEVPEEVAQEIERSRRARERYYNTMDKLLNAKPQE